MDRSPTKNVGFQIFFNIVVVICAGYVAIGSYNKVDIYNNYTVILSSILAVWFSIKVLSLVWKLRK